MRVVVLTLTGWLLASSTFAQGTSAQTAPGVGVTPLAGAAASAQAPARDNRPPTVGTASVSGRIVDADSGVPLRRAMVRLGGGGMRETHAVSSDADGRYSFRNLPAGQFTLSASKDGYLNWGYAQKRPFELSKPIKLAANQAATDLDIRLPRGGVITGRVLDEYGEAVAGVSVGALRFQYTPRGKEVAVGRTAMSDDIGEFRLFGLAPSEYLITASIPRYGNPSEVNDDHRGYAPTYYPGTVDDTQAQSIHLSAGQLLGGLTIMLIPTRTARVSGTVVDGEGRPAVNGGVTAVSRSRVRTSAGSAPINRDGTFVLGALVPGTYILRAQTSGQGPAQVPAEAMLTVNGEDLAGVRIAPIALTTIRGRVVTDPPDAPGFVERSVRFTLMPLDPLGFSSIPGAPEPVRADFTFEMKARPGRFIVQPSGIPPGWMIRRLLLDGRDVSNGLEIGGADLDGLEIHLTNRGAAISGAVRTSRGDATDQFTTIVFSQDSAAWPSRVRMAGPDMQGKFGFRTLTAGDYYVAAIDHVEQGQWFDPEFLELIRPQATAISLAEGESSTLDLRLIELQ